MSEPDQIHQQDAAIGYDTSEPRNWAIVVVALSIGLTIVVIFFGVQWWYTYIKEKETYERVLAPTSEILKQVHARERWNLNTYQYLDKNKTQVRIPIERAKQLVLEEYAAGKVSWPTQPTPVKVEAPGGAAGGTGAQQGAPAATATAGAPAAAPAATGSTTHAPQH